MGVRVAVRYGGGEDIFLGTAGAADGDGRREVTYDDGDVAVAEAAWITAVAPLASLGAAVDARVLARFEDGNWYWGAVTAVGDGAVDVAFDDGDALAGVALGDALGVAAAPAEPAAEPAPPDAPPDAPPSPDYESDAFDADDAAAADDGAAAAVAAADDDDGAAAVDADDGDAPDFDAPAGDAPDFDAGFAAAEADDALMAGGGGDLGVFGAFGAESDDDEGSGCGGSPREPFLVRAFEGGGSPEPGTPEAGAADLVGGGLDALGGGGSVDGGGSADGGGASADGGDAWGFGAAEAPAPGAARDAPDAPPARFAAAARLRADGAARAAAPPRARLALLLGDCAALEARLERDEVAAALGGGAGGARPRLGGGPARDELLGARPRRGAGVVPGSLRRERAARDRSGGRIRAPGALRATIARPNARRRARNREGAPAGRARRDARPARRACARSRSRGSASARPRRRRSARSWTSPRATRTRASGPRPGATRRARPRSSTRPRRPATRPRSRAPRAARTTRGARRPPRARSSTSSRASSASPRATAAACPGTTSSPRSAAWNATPGVLTKLSSSVTSKSIRLMFGRIDCSRRVLEARPKSSRRHRRIYAHIEAGSKI